MKKIDEKTEDSLFMFYMNQYSLSPATKKILIKIYETIKKESKNRRCMNQNFIAIKPVFWSQVDSVYKYTRNQIICNLSHIISISQDEHIPKAKLDEVLHGKTIYTVSLSDHNHSSAIKCTSSAIDAIVESLDKEIT
jgi:hypothetical protein